MYQEFIWVRLMLTFSCCSLLTSYYFVIESIYVLFCLTMLFIKLFWYKARVVELVYKIFIVNEAYLSICQRPGNSDLWPFQVMNWYLLGERGRGGGGYELSYSGGGGGLVQVGDKTLRWGVCSKVWGHHKFCRSSLDTFYLDCSNIPMCIFA